MTTPAPIDVNRGMTTSDDDMIEAYIEHLRRLNRSPVTIEKRRALLGRVNNELTYGVAETTTEELADWLHREQWSRATRATYYTALRSFYTWATRPRDQWITFDPTIDLEEATHPKGLPRPITDDELAFILKRLREPYKTWSKLAAYQGLRAVEISRLDREHVTQEKLLVVRGKGGKRRIHDTDPYVWEAIRPLPPGPVARKRNGERANAGYVSRQAIYHYRLIGMQGVSLHRLRHWLGTTTQRIYRDIRVTQAMLGHESLSSTQVYTDATVEQQREARSILPRLAG